MKRPRRKENTSNNKKRNGLEDIISTCSMIYSGVAWNSDVLGDDSWLTSSIDSNFARLELISESESFPIPASDEIEFDFARFKCDGTFPLDFSSTEFVFDNRGP